MDITSFKKIFIKIRLVFSLCLLITMSGSAFAYGMKSQQLVAQQVMEIISNKELKNYLFKYQDAYLMGVLFPDSGALYQSYEQLVHTEKFKSIALKYIKHKCEMQDYTQSNNCFPLTAFFLGIITHQLIDQSFNQVFLPQSIINDFGGNKILAEQFNLKQNLDLIVQIEQIDLNKSIKMPQLWIPIHDLSMIFQEMNEYYSQDHLLWSVLITYGVLHKKANISPITYLYLKAKIKNTFKTSHYMEGLGGVMHSSQKVALELSNFWHEFILETKGNKHDD